MPDADNVIPIVDGDWFEDDIVARFRQFLRVAFGEQHFEENLRFVTESLGVKNLRDYFVKSFYKDHVQRYKKRPIYWLFSSPKGSFNALIYMHRYTPSTVSTVLNEYLREFQAKLKSRASSTPRRVQQREGSRPAPQGAAGARRVRARRALPAGVPADRHRPRRRRQGQLPEVRCRPQEDPRAWRRTNDRSLPPSAPTWSAASTTIASCSGTTRRASTPPTSTASTCRRDDDPGRQRRVRHQEPPAARPARGQVPRLPLRSGARRASATGCSTWSSPTVSSPRTAARSCRRTSVSPPTASTRSSRRMRSSSTPASASRASRRC